MENAEVWADLASNLIEASARNTARFIANRIKAVKAKKNDKETINELEEIIQIKNFFIILANFANLC